MKAIGSYLLLFSFAFGYTYKYNKLILEVSNPYAADVISCLRNEDLEDDYYDDESYFQSIESDLNYKDILTFKLSTLENTIIKDNISIKSFKNSINKLNKSQLIKLYNSLNILEKKDGFVYSLNKKDLIRIILLNKFWNFEEYEKEISQDPKKPWNFKNCDPKIYGYHGTKYKIGKKYSKNLYCNFYNAAGFNENPKLNTDMKCFSIEPLPAMEFNLTKQNKGKVLSFFTDRIKFDPSDFCIN